MNPMSIDTFLIVLILANIFLGVLFVAHQKQGHDFVSAFDKACVWAGSFFIGTYCINAAAYMAWA